MWYSLLITVLDTVCFCLLVFFSFFCKLAFPFLISFLFPQMQRFPRVFISNTPSSEAGKLEVVDEVRILISSVFCCLWVFSLVIVDTVLCILFASSGHRLLSTQMLLWMEKQPAKTPIHSLTSLWVFCHVQCYFTFFLFVDVV